ncbi:MAG: hypothetical protein O7F73_19325 [Gammaproteobacteria bacterium]|nr:hypothetical protein [Gammaproteobacteria bacterium]
MKIINTLVIALFAGLLLGCSSGDKDGEQQGAIPAGPLKALEKARGTEKMLQDADEKRRKEMEERGI